MNRKARSFTIGAVALGALALASLAFAACGDDDKSPSTATAAGGAATTAASGGAATTASGGSSSASASATSASNEGSPGSGQVTGSGADALKGLAKDLSDKSYKVTYNMSVTSDEETTKGILTLSQKPPKNAFSFNVSDSPDGPENTSFIDDGTNTYTCYSTSDTEGVCLKAKSDGSASPFSSVYSVGAILNELTDSVEVTDAGSKTIAGADSKCFNVKEEDGSQSVACFAKSSGLLTSISGENDAEGDATTLVATSISGSADDSDFAPPKGYQIQDSGG